MFNCFTVEQGSPYEIRLWQHWPVLTPVEDLLIVHPHGGCDVQALLLSEELHLDEIQSLLCLVTAHDEVGVSWALKASLACFLLGSGPMLWKA
jgi:hypothetical protein